MLVAVCLIGGAGPAVAQESVVRGSLTGAVVESDTDRPVPWAEVSVVPVDEQVNTLSFDPYQRVDIRISYKINGKRVGTEIALDLLNILNAKNVLNYAYSPDPANYNASPLVLNYQLGFLPLFYVKVDF